MSITWNSIHQHLLHVSSSLRFQCTFDHLRRRHASLSCFSDSAALLDALHHGSGTSEQKNVILKTLVGAAQSGTEETEGAVSVLLLALWPGLDAVHHRLSRRYGSGANGVSSDILARTVEAIHDLDLGRVHRIAATVLMNVERDLGRAHAREARRQSLLVEIDADQIATGSCAFPNSTKLLHRDVARIVGDDVRLVFRVAIEGFSQGEVAGELGLTEAAARKRYQRAVRRLRQEYSDSLSGSELLPGISRAGAFASSQEMKGARQMARTDDTNDLARLPGLFRRWELSDVLKARRTYRLEEAGAHADGTPLVAVYTSTPMSRRCDHSGSNDDAMPNEGGS